MATWLITGCSTGLGRALAQAVLAHGHNAVVTARNVTTVEDLTAAFPDTALALPLDVTDRTADQLGGGAGKDALRQDRCAGQQRGLRLPRRG